MAQLLISAVGGDRPGIVGELTAHLHSARANILDSRMVNLRGQFAMMILLDCPEESARRLQAGLVNVGSQMGLELKVLPLPAVAKPVAGMPFRLKTYSMDQPGIVARLTGVLRTLGVNIEELSARQESAPFSGSSLFVTEITMTVPATVALDTLRKKLDEAGGELNCDIDLDPAN